MSATAPTPQARLYDAKTTYISWSDFDFELTDENTYRPQLTQSEQTKVETNVETLVGYSENSGIEPWKLTCLYSPTIWASLKTAKEDGTSATFETSDGLSIANVKLIGLDEVRAKANGKITSISMTFAKDDCVVVTGGTSSGT